MKVVILGMGPRSIEHPSDAEVWVINGPRFPPRWDRLFQLHGLDHITARHGAGYLERLAAIAPPQRLYMTAEHPELLPHAKRFPIENVKRRAGNYFTSSVPMVIAFAELRGARQIWLDGMMYAGGDSAQWGASERWAVPCVEFHIGVAMARGVRVHVPRGCGLIENSHVYGFEGPGSV